MAYLNTILPKAANLGSPAGPQSLMPMSTPTAGATPKAPGMGAQGIGAIAQGVNSLGQMALGAAKKDTTNAQGVQQVDVDNAKASGALGGAASGAGMGATIGSILPGPGTAIGAAVGGLAGATMGFLSGEADAEKQQQAIDEQAQAEMQGKQQEADRIRSAALLAKYGANLRNMYK